MQYCLGSSNLQLNLGWCLWVKFIWQVQFCFFLDSRQTLPFERFHTFLWKFMMISRSSHLKSSDFEHQKITFSSPKVIISYIDIAVLREVEFQDDTRSRLLEQKKQCPSTHRSLQHHLLYILFQALFQRGQLFLISFS